MSQISASTTDEDLLVPVTAARKALAQAVEAGHDSGRLAGCVNDVAEAEGRMAVRYALRNAMASNATVEDTREHLTRLLFNGADDRWSGRKNDAARAKFDGIRTEVASLVQFRALERLMAGQEVQD